MRPINSVVLVALAAFIGVASGEEPAKSGIYVGAEVGSAKADTVVQSPTWQYHVDNSTTGWGVFAGFRPAKYLGAEFNYIDFGTSEKHNLNDGNGNITYNASAKNDAYAGFVVGYLPLMPSWDVFGKLGYASLNTKTDSNGFYPNVCNVIPPAPCTPVGMASLSQRHRSGEFAYGFGTQYQFNSMSVRVEYQRIDGSRSNPNLLSAGVAWHF